MQESYTLPETMPRLTKDLPQYLRHLIPYKLPSPGVSMDQVMFEAGKQELIAVIGNLIIQGEEEESER